MAKGDRNFSTEGRQVSRFSNKPAPAGEYELKLISSKAEVKAPNAQNPRGVPYVGGVRFQVVGSGENGGKDKTFFHSFFCSLLPGSDGKVMPERGGQIVDYAHALGDKFNGSVISVHTPGGEKGGVQLDPQEVDALDPIQLCKWLKERDGAIVKGRIKVQKNFKDATQEENAMDYFIAAEATSDEDEEAEEEIEETEDEDSETEEDEAEETEEEDAEEAEEAEEEEEPAPKPKAKVTPLGAKKPASKQVVKGKVVKKVAKR